MGRRRPRIARQIPRRGRRADSFELDKYMRSVIVLNVMALASMRVPERCAWAAKHWNRLDHCRSSRSALFDSLAGANSAEIAAEDRATPLDALSDLSPKVYSRKFAAGSAS